MKLLLTLGPGLNPRSHGDVVVIDWATRKIVDTFRYVHRVYDQSHKGLAGATWYGQRLLVASEAELLEFDVAPLRLVEARTFPFLNDVHHIAGSPDRIWVCNTGLDCVEEFDSAWQLLKTHHLVGAFGRRPRHLTRLARDDVRKSWRRLRGQYDYYAHLQKRPAFRNVVKLCWQNAYRKNGQELRYSDFRPHVLHPNHIIPRNGDQWVTLWRTGEIVSLRTGKILAEGLGRPHDGVVIDETLYVTDCRSNRLVVYNVADCKRGVGQKIAERTITDRNMEGFLRGVAVVGDHVFVGLTARRGAPEEFRSARIVALHRWSLEPVDEWLVPNEFGLQIFSLLDATHRYA